MTESDLAIFVAPAIGSTFNLKSPHVGQSFDLESDVLW